VDLCVVKPTSLLELRRVSGFGDKRVEMYGKEILDALRRFRGGDRASNEGKPKSILSAKKPCASSKKVAPFEEIAKIRSRTLRAVVSLVADMIERGRRRISARLASPERLQPNRRRLSPVGNGPPKAPQGSPPARNPLRRNSLVIARLRTEIPSR